MTPAFSSSRMAVVLCKELRDNLRDRRSLIMALTMPLLAPVATIGLMSALMANMSRDEVSKEILIPAVGFEQTPGLVDHLRQSNIRLTSAPRDPEAAVAAREAEAVLVIPPGYAANFSSGRPATVRVVLDGSRKSSLARADRLTRALSAYGVQVASLRLLARGVSPEVVTPLAIESADQASPQSRGAILLGSLVMFMIITIFMGGMYIAIDVTAGERERGSLEPLLANPITEAELVLGKLGAVIVFAAGSFLALLVILMVVLRFVPLEMPGMNVGLSPAAAGWIVVALGPLVLLASVLDLAVASACRTFKEGQTALGFITLVPLVVSVLNTLDLVDRPRFAMLVPVYAQTLLVDRVLRGEPFAWSGWAEASGVVCALAVALGVLTVARYDRQRVLFR